MSASLVGSEMCIRDRPCRARAARTCLREAVGQTAAASSGEVMHVEGILCLLYTSDAADDM
eukprot:2517453-Alexandrium_andersonii.AAC.1